MSSIYKKGRDGYYYYQTYIYNPESKKKDKRIFYALGTKDLLEAKEKQYELDLQHDNQNYIKSNSLRSFYNSRPNQTIAIIVGLIATIVLLVFFYIIDNAKQQSIGSVTDEANNLLTDTIDFEKPIINNQLDLETENIQVLIKANPEPKNVEPNVIIPDYFVERVDRLSGAFEQGKIYVTLDKNSSIESQKLLCENLTKRYNEFSNIVICIYTNNSAGKNLARGNGELVSVNEKKRSWLAMYTYNSVEGEYFDANPTGYLGTY
tara:strand:+ start:600 stop:1388 length:789 start_codon:yes stop_codon:yes gene_type:complete